MAGRDRFYASEIGSGPAVAVTTPGPAGRSTFHAGNSVPWRLRPRGEDRQQDRQQAHARGRPGRDQARGPRTMARGPVDRPRDDLEHKPRPRARPTGRWCSARARSAARGRSEGQGGQGCNRHPRARPRERDPDRAHRATLARIQLLDADEYPALELSVGTLVTSNLDTVRAWI